MGMWIKSYKRQEGYRTTSQSNLVPMHSSRAGIPTFTCSTKGISKGITKGITKGSTIGSTKGSSRNISLSTCKSNIIPTALRICMCLEIHELGAGERLFVTHGAPRLWQAALETRLAAKPPAREREQGTRRGAWVTVDPSCQRGEGHEGRCGRGHGGGIGHALRHSAALCGDDTLRAHPGCDAGCDSCAAWLRPPMSADPRPCLPCHPTCSPTSSLA
jgi:hypothetical protein